MEKIRETLDQLENGSLPKVLILNLMDDFHEEVEYPSRGRKKFFKPVLKVEKI